MDDNDALRGLCASMRGCPCNEPIVCRDASFTYCKGCGDARRLSGVRVCKLRKSEIAAMRRAREPNAPALPCALCGKPADRFIDAGLSGVRLYCGAHEAAELEPFACAPITGTALYVTDEDVWTTLDSFIAANKESIDCGALDIDAIINLAVGEEYSDGGGAAAEWTIRRVT